MRELLKTLHYLSKKPLGRFLSTLPLLTILALFIINF